MALPPPPPPWPAGATRPAAPRLVDPRELRPRRWWYWVAGALVTVGLGIGFVLGARALVGLLQLRDLDEFTTGEEAEFVLDPDRPSSVFVHQSNETTVPLVDCTGDAAPGAAIELIATDLEDTVIDGTELWVEEYEIEVSGRGTYSIECRGLDSLGELRLGIGPRADPVASLSRFNVVGLASTVATGAGVLVGLVVGLRRSSHKRRLMAERRAGLAPLAGTALTYSRRHGDPARRQGGAGDGGVAGDR